MLKVRILHNAEVVEGKIEDLKSKHTTVWMDVTDPEAGELATVAEHIGVDSRELQDLLHPHQRPILQDLGNFTAVVFHGPESKPVLFLTSKEQKDFITLHEAPNRFLQKINAYSPKHKAEVFRSGSTALLFAGLNEVVAGGFEIIDRVSEEVSKLEEQVFGSNSSQVLKRVFSLKKQLINLQRVLSADREVVSAIEKSYGQFLDAKLLSNFRLLYSDLTQLIEMAATYRDITISVVEVHLSAISNNLNVVMKKLTAWAAIILVPSLIAGIYGMNFAILPPLARSPQGFWLILGAMGISVLVLYGYFKYHDWI